MKKVQLLLLLILIKFPLYALQHDTLTVRPFGKVVIYKPDHVPSAFVIFISGDGGWNSGVIDMANNILNQGAMVVGVDIRQYFKLIKSQKVKCYYPAGDFESLSLRLQRKYKLPSYQKPLLVGYSSGATLVYGALAQAPANTFKGAISLGFCPDIDLDKTLCKGSGLSSHVLKPGKSFYLESANTLAAPFIVLQGMADNVCLYTEIKDYLKNTKSAELVTLPKVGHGFSVTKNWLPQFITAFKKINSAPNYAEKKSYENSLLQSQHLEPLSEDLPLTLIPAVNKDNVPMAFMISGDGGWTSFDQSLSEQFATKNIPVVGLDAQKYFWDAKTPEQCAKSVEAAIEHYMKQWNRNSFILIGYSFGACVVPFIANNFTNDLLEKMGGVFSLLPDKNADFEIHISDMLDIGSGGEYNIVDEIKRIRPLHPVCVFGDEDDENVIKEFQEAGAKIVMLPGGHHFNDDYEAVSEVILKNIISSH